MGNGAGKNEMAKNRKINVQGNEITIIGDKGHEYISLTDMLKAKDGDFFISDWLRNRNTVEYLVSGKASIIQILIMANST